MDEDMSDLFQVLFIFMTCCLAFKKRQNRRRPRRKRRCWSRSWLLRRNKNLGGVLSCVFNELLVEDKRTFKNYLRMDEDSFNELLTIIRPHIQKQDTNMRMAISPEMRLALTLRCLATGETFSSLSISCRIAPNTVGVIIRDTLQQLKEHLKPLYLKAPNTVEEWEEIAKDYYDIWNMPNCCGALDGKHIRFRAPRSQGSFYYNYKGYNSTVLMALVDAHRKFIVTDIGANGRMSDGGIFIRSQLKRDLDSNSLNLPPDKPLPGRNLAVPHVIVADGAFALTPRMIIPYRDNSRQDPLHKSYNKRISRARNNVENAFGILAARFRVFNSAIELTNPDMVDLITEVSCILHNFLIEKRPDIYGNIEGEEVAPLPGIGPQIPVHCGNNVRLEFLQCLR